MILTLPAIFVKNVEQRFLQMMLFVLNVEIKYIEEDLWKNTVNHVD